MNRGRAYDKTVTSEPIASRFFRSRIVRARCKRPSTPEKIEPPFCYSGVAHDADTILRFRPGTHRSIVRVPSLSFQRDGSYQIDVGLDRMECPLLYFYLLPPTVLPTQCPVLKRRFLALEPDNVIAMDARHSLSPSSMYGSAGMIYV
ncbi:hypothetical protein CIRG_02489 [Coccidioides immitis RMSCC 2394]|uniref:Uncharacterized protein n=1 Tax=Coccidioides immitis RMSCC 2394 TaxID=404692 RepID=A0A0J7AZ82_COCIT|nr:hypothetical protein CIRG_02489 [Coccidioides immitis RMSCC 2394]